MNLSVSFSPYNTFFVQPPYNSIEYIKSLNLNDAKNIELAVEMLFNCSSEKAQEFINYLKNQGLFVQNLHSLIPIFKKLSLENISEEILTMTDLPSESIWEFIKYKKKDLCHCNQEIFTLFRPLLNKLTAEQLIDIISYQKDENDEIEILNDDERPELIYYKDIGILNDDQKYLTILSILMETESLEYVLKILQSEAWLRAVNFSSSRFKSLTTLIKKFPEEIIKKIFSFKYHEKTLLHSYFLESLPIVCELENEHFKELMRLKDSEGDNPFLYWMISRYYAAIYEFRLDEQEVNSLKAYEDKIIEILSYVDENSGLTLLHRDVKYFSILMLFFNQLTPKKLKNILNISDNFGKILLDQPGISEQAELLIKKLEKNSNEDQWDENIEEEWRGKIPNRPIYQDSWPIAIESKNIPNTTDDGWSDQCNKITVEQIVENLKKTLENENDGWGEAILYPLL